MEEEMITRITKGDNARIDFFREGDDDWDFIQLVREIYPDVDHPLDYYKFSFSWESFWEKKGQRS